MYGLVNKALENMIIENHGENNWMAIKKRANLDINAFISNVSYPDEVTYNLISSTSAELNMNHKLILYDFGKYWVLRTGVDSYGELFQSAGSSLKEFLINLQDFHARVMLYYPKLSPPTFFVANVNEESLDLHYKSHRHGLTEFVRGLIDGLAELYDTQVVIEFNAGFDGHMAHDIFHIKFII